MKPNIVIIIVVVILAVVAMWYVGNHHPNASHNVESVPNISTQKPPNYTSESDTASHTTKIDLELIGVEPVDTLIRAGVESSVTAFVGEADRTYADNPSDFVREGGKWSNVWNGAITNRSGKVLNYRLDGYEYTGGAHGNPVVVTYVVDTTNPSRPPLTIADVFKPGSDFVSVLSSVSRELLLLGRVEPHDLAAAIAEQPEMSFTAAGIADGTRPDVQNFSNFSLEHPGIRIIFTAYQIGPYAIGQPEIVIPWDRVKDIVNPEVLEKVHSE